MAWLERIPQAFRRGCIRHPSTMHRGYKVISVTPAGRRPYLEILHLHLMRQRHVIDRHRWWVNTDKPADIEYIQSLVAEFPDFYEIEFLPDGVKVDRIYTIHHFFRNCIDPDTLYVRLDDDVCFIAEGTIERLLDFRIDHPEPFLVYPVIINNCLITDILQEQGALSQAYGRAGYYAAGEGWRNPKIAHKAHEELLAAYEQRDLKRFIIPDRTLGMYEWVSINCIVWTGKDFADFGGIVLRDEERWLSVEKPKELGRPNVICGDALVSHFAFVVQRSYLENETNLLASYRLLALKMLAEHASRQS